MITTRTSPALARIRARLPDGLADAVWLWLLLRVGLTIIAGLVVVTGRAAIPCATDAPLAWLPRDGLAFPLLGAWHHWDACWYTTIASTGYGVTEGSGATTFFPFLPLVAGLLARGRDALPLAFAAVNAVALVVALVGIRRLVTRDVDRPTAERTALYIVVFPAALFLVAPFTEAIFLAAVVWAFIGARERRWELALIAGVVAGLARPLGVLLVLPLAWEAFQVLLERRRTGERLLRPADLLAGLAIAGPGLAYLGYVAWTSVVVGQSYFESHAAWGEHHLVVPWEPIAAGVTYAFEHARPAQLVNAGAWLLFAVLTILGLRRLPVSYWLFVIPQLVLAISQATVWPLMSTGRYMLVLFPGFVVLAMAGRHRRFHESWLVLSALLLAFLTVLFVQGSMVG